MTSLFNLTLSFHKPETSNHIISKLSYQLPIRFFIPSKISCLLKHIVKVLNLSDKLPYQCVDTYTCVVVYEFSLVYSFHVMRKTCTICIDFCIRGKEPEFTIIIYVLGINNVRIEFKIRKE